MESVFDVLVWVLVALVSIPLAVLAMESWLAALRGLRPTSQDDTANRPSTAVLIPAHNEEAGIARTLSAVMKQLRPGDRCVVVADNCTDSTAAVARSFGAEVVERFDAERRGKGFALDAGIRHLSGSPPGVLILIDADCDVAPDAIDALAIAAGKGRPVQGINVLHPPAESGLKGRLSAYAFYFKNVIRPLGLARSGGPCPLFGTGLALQCHLLVHTRLATGNIVEDLQLGIDLARAGFPARFLPVPCVSGEFPSGDRAATAQRRRWEHGHVRTLLHQAPNLIATGLFRGRPSLVLLGLDLAVPPLSLLALATAMMLCVAGCNWAVTDGSEAFVFALAVVGFTLTGAFASWLRHGRSWIGWRDLLRFPIYVAWKLPIYLGLVFRPQRAWIRAERARGGLEEPNPQTPFPTREGGFECPSPEGRGLGLRPSPLRGGAASEASGVGSEDLTPKPHPKVTIDGLAFDAIDEAECVRHIVSEAAGGRGGWVVTPNLDYLRRARRSAEFRGLIDQATLCVADGMPLVWAARLQGTPLPGRVAGSSLIVSLAEGAAKAGQSIYLLGGEPGAAEGAERVLCSRFPGLKVAGTSSPRVGDVPDKTTLDGIAATLESSGLPTIVFVGLGSPKTERLIAALRERFPKTWFLGVGVSFSFLSGQVRRAPRWVQRAGLEWVFRLTQEPRRLARRYLVDGIPFAVAMLARAAFRPPTRKATPPSGGAIHGV